MSRMKIDDEQLRELRLKACLVDALSAADRDMTFVEAAEFLSLNGCNMLPEDVKEFFESEGLIYRLRIDHLKLTGKGLASRALRVEESWDTIEYWGIPGADVSNYRQSVFVTVKGQLLLAEQFLFNDGRDDLW